MATFALATNILIVHNCWHLQSKLSPLLLWCGVDLADTTRISGHTSQPLSVHAHSSISLSKEKRTKLLKSP